MLRFLLEKEFKQILRNSFVPKLIVAMPLMMMLIMPWAANQEVKDIKLNVVDNDHSTASDRLTRKAAASAYFILTGTPVSHDAAMRAVEAGEADLVLEIPKDFERDMVREGRSAVNISANAVNGTKGALAASYLNSIVADFSEDLRNEAGATSEAAQTMTAFKTVPQYKFNAHLDYKVFMVPALMVMLLTMLAGYLPALNIVGEKEAGTIEQINVTPTRRIYFVLAKLIPYWLIGFLVLSLCMGLAALVYGLTPVGNVATIYLFATVYVLAVSGMGLIVSNYSETLQQAMFVMFFFVMILLLMSGLFTPVESMPAWAQAVTVLNPLKYFIQVMRMVYLKGSALSDLMPQFGALCVFALVLNTWAVLSYRKSN